MKAAAAVVLLTAAVPASCPFTLSGSPMQGGIVIGVAPAGTVELRLDDRVIRVDSDNRFLVAFDRDASAQARITARLTDGSIIARALSVTSRAWRIERVNAPLRPARNTESFLALRRQELDRIAAARAQDTGAQGWRQQFIWPRVGRISGLFGSQRIYQGAPGPYHGGIDIAGQTGDPVVAPADGVVTLAAEQPFTLEGLLLMVDHGNGLGSAFLHLSRIDVRPGQTVRQGQIVGAIGSTGRATGPHLHWGVRWHEARIDPMLLVGTKAPL